MPQSSAKHASIKRYVALAFAQSYSSALIALVKPASERRHQRLAAMVLANQDLQGGRLLVEFAAISRQDTVTATADCSFSEPCTLPDSQYPLAIPPNGCL